MTSSPEGSKYMILLFASWDLVGDMAFEELGKNKLSNSLEEKDKAHEFNSYKGYVWTIQYKKKTYDW